MILIFDFDGTLHRTDHIYGIAVRKVLNELFMEGVLSAALYEKKGMVTDMELSRYLGVPAEKMWEEFLPELKNITDLPGVIKAVGKYMNEAVLSGTSSLFAGARDVLTELVSRGHTLVLLSNCTEKYLNAQRKHFNLDNWFSDYYCSETYHGLPKEQIFMEIRKKYTGSFMMIGDRASDIVVGTYNNFPTIGCLYGYGDDTELSDATFLVQSIADIPSVIEHFSDSIC